MADARLDFIIDATRAVAGAKAGRTALSSLSKAALQTEKDLNRLKKMTVSIKVNKTGLSELSREAKVLSKTLDGVSRKAIVVKADTSALKAVTQAAKTAESSLKSLRNVAVNIRVNKTGLGELNRNVKALSKTLDEVNRKAVSIKADSSALKSIAQAARTAEVSLKNLRNAVVTVKVNRAGLGELTREVRALSKILDEVNRKAISIKADSSALKSIAQAARTAEVSLKNLRNVVVTVKVNKTGLGELTREVRALSKILDEVNRKSLSVKADSSALRSIAQAARTAEVSLKNLRNAVVTIKVNQMGLEKVSTKLTAISRAVRSVNTVPIRIRITSTSLRNIDSAAKSLGTLATAAVTARTALASLRTSSIGIRVAQGDLRQASVSAASLRTALTSISSITVRPKVSLVAIQALITAAKTAKVELDKINRVRVNPRLQSRALVSLTTVARQINTQLTALNAKVVSPKVNLTQLNRLSTKLKQIQAQVRALNTSSANFGASISRSAQAGTRGLNNLAKSARTARTSISSIGTATAGVNAALGGVNAAGVGFGALGRSFTGASRSGAGFGRTLGKIVSPLTKIGSVLGVVTGGLAATTIGFADASIQIANKIRLVTGESEDLLSVQAELFRQSQDARVSFAAQADLYQRIGLSAKDLGINTNEILLATEGVAKAITLSAASAQAANATIIQFGQALAFGKLRGDELRSVLEQSPRLATALADGLGIARGELVKFGFAGDLVSKDVLQALLSQVPKLRQEFETLEPRIKESATTLSNSFIRLGGALDKATGISGNAAQGLLDLAATIDRGAPNAIKLLSDFGAAWTNFWEIANRNIVVSGITSTFDLLTDSVIGSVKLLGSVIGDGIELFSQSAFDETFDRLAEVTKKINELSTARAEYQDQIDALAQRKRTGTFDPTTVVDLQIQVDAVEAEEKIKQIRKDLKGFQDEKFKLDVITDFDQSKKNLRLLEDEVKRSSAKFKLTPDFRQLQEGIANLKNIIKEVEDEGLQLKITTPELQRDFDRLNRLQDSLEQLLPPVSEKGEAPNALKPGELAGQGEAAKALKDSKEAIQSLIEAQRELIIELENVAGIETDLAKLRAVAGDDAVNNVEGLIRANDEYIQSQQRSRDIDDAARGKLDDLKEQLSALEGLTEAERLRQDVELRGIQTAEEASRIEDLKKQLIELYKIADGTEDLTEKTRVLAAQREIALKLSPGQAEEKLALAKSIEDMQALVDETNELTKAREAAQKIVTTNIDQGVDTSQAGRIQTDIKTVQNELDRLGSVSLSDLTQEDLTFIEQAPEALGILEMRLVEAGERSKDTLSEIENFAEGVKGAVEDTLGDAIFAGMQGRWDDLNSAMLDTFQRTIDRMVADALSAKLADTLFGAFSGGGLGAGLFSGDVGGSGGSGPSGLASGGFAPANSLTEVNERGQEMLTINNLKMMIPMPGDGNAFKPVGSRENGGFTSPNSIVEVNERGQEMLTLGMDKFLIPKGMQDVRRREPLELETRGLASGGFAKPNEMVEVNENLNTMAKQQRVSNTAMRASSPSEPQVLHTGDRTFMRMGSSGGFVIPADKTEDLLGGEASVRPVLGREFGGAVQSRSAFEVNEGVMPELLSIGSRDFLMTGGASGFVTPLDSASELGRSVTVNMTVVSPDVDGFRKSQGQIQNDLTRIAGESSRRNG